MSKKIRNSKWTKEKIFAAINNYIEKNNCLPSMKTLENNPQLPNHTSIKNRFGITVINFYQTYYPEMIHLCNSNIYHYHTKEYWLSQFKEQYSALNFPTLEQYDKLRNPNSPSLSHLIKIAEVKKKSDLLKICKLTTKDRLTTNIINLNENHYSNLSESIDKLL